MAQSSGRTVALMPIQAAHVLTSNRELRLWGKNSLVESVVQVAMACGGIHEVYVFPDDELIADVARDAGASVPFVRDVVGPESYQTVPEVLEELLGKIENEQEEVTVDTVVYLSSQYPFRTSDVIEKVLELKFCREFDSVFTVRKSTANYWYRDSADDIVRLFKNNYYFPRERSEVLYQEMLGLVTVTDRRWITGGDLLGANVGVVPIDKIQYQIDLRDPLWQLIDKNLDLKGLQT